MVSLDYYSVLGLTRSATDVDVKKAFRTLALKYHPSRDASDNAATEFARVCEAYDVLSKPERKGTYDLHGEEVLKSGKPDESGSRKGGIYNFKLTACDQIFNSFFGTSNPFEALEDMSSMFQVMTTSKKAKEGKTQAHPVKLTLEELYHGCLKKVVFLRKKLDTDGSVETEERELVIDVRPGLPDGTRFVFEGEGNAVSGKCPGAVVFVLETLPHPVYKRQGSDILHKATVPLYHALQGSGIRLQLLSGTESTIPVDNIITPGYKVSVPSSGLPLPGQEGKFGTLKIEIDVLFPTKLSDAQKMLLKAAFYLPNRLEDCDAVRSFRTAFQDHVTGWESCVPGHSSA